jgi:predicted dehydrogenase|tara:strand:+ start:639 stop:1661 length:1023 start_codon:yes stop_codon:yes gene_type:complete
MINVALIGLGYWGPNLLRNMSSIEDVRIVTLCDKNIENANGFKKQLFPDVNVVDDYKEVANDSSVDAVLIATPIETHFEIGAFLLSSGKHVFIEKPLARNVEECVRLIDLAAARKLVLMVGHVFEYNPAVRWIRDYIKQGELGNILYLYSQRVNLGRIQNSTNALWSFAPHDISIVNYWLGKEPVSVSVRGFSCLTNNIEDVVFVVLDYPEGVGVHLHLGWLDPRKIRLMTLVGSRKMLVYDDVSMDSKIRIYDKGFAGLDEFLEVPQNYAEFQFKLRSGDIVIPKINFHEPVQIECEHFVDCIMSGKTPDTDGLNGLSVVKTLEAAEKSLKQGGKPIHM